MRTEREELAGIIGGKLITRSSMTETAETVLAAGYRKPQQVTTVEELDALPNASVILDGSQYCREAAKVSDGNVWRSMGPAAVRSSREIRLPATVLHVGGAE